MELHDLAKLEALAKRRHWRVRLMGASGVEYLPGLLSPGVSFARAQRLLARVESIAWLGLYADPVIVGPDLIPPPHTPHTPPPHTPPHPATPHPTPAASKLRALASSEGIDLDLLVNPEALAAALDTTLIR